MKHELRGTKAQKKATTEEDLLAMSEDLKEYIDEAMLAGEHLKASFKE